MGCGKQATPPAASAPTGPGAAVVAKNAGAPTSALRRYWGAAPNHNVKVYGDLSGLSHTELFGLLVPSLLQTAGESLGPKQQACVSAVLAGAKEVGVSGGEHGGLFMLSFDPSGLEGARTACVGTVVSTDRATVAGASEAYAVGGNHVLAVDHDVVVLGSRELVTAALAPHNPGPWPKELTLAAEQRLAAVVDVQGISAHGALFVGPERFRLEVIGQAPSEEMAQGAEAAARGMIRELRDSVQVPGAPEAVPLQALLGALTITRRATQLTSVFELKGQSAQAQAAVFNTAFAVGVAALERYAASAKEAEAYNGVRVIADNYRGSLSLPSTKKLISLPPVPARVPSGTSYQSSAADWKAWSPIRFSLNEPQFYQYEVVAAKDGKTAEIIARGDLDGDGKQSRISLKLALDTKSGAVTVSTPEVDATDPME